MFKNFKTLAVMAVMAVCVIGQSAEAREFDRNDRRDRHDRRDRNDRDHGRYSDRWVCNTQSRGYTFRAEGRSQYEAQNNVVNMCLRHPYGASSECRYAVQCQNLSVGYPYPQPAPRFYTCQTFARGQWYRAQSRDLHRAQRQVLNQCYNRSGMPRQCERNLQCGY